MGSASKSMGTSVWLIFLLVSGPMLRVQASPSATEQAYDCDQCTLTNDKVCGKDGDWYQNRCIAYCAQVDIDTTGNACRGADPFWFDDYKPGPSGAESNGLGGIKTLTTDIINAFKDEGLRYVGRTKLSKEAAIYVPDGPISQPEPEKDAAGNWQVDAIRCTSAGDVYKGRMRISRSAAEMESAGPSPLAPWFKNQAPAGARPAHDSQNRNEKLVAESGSYAAQPQQQEQQQVKPVVQQPQPQSWFSKLRDMFTGLFKGSKSTAGSSSSSSSSSSTVIQPAAVEVDLSTGDNHVFAVDQEAVGGKQSDASSVDEDWKLIQDLLADIDSDKKGSSSSSSSSNLSFSTTTINSTNSSLDGKHRRLLEIIGQDSRFDCDKGYPYTAIGQIQVVDNSGLYICTGTLIKPDKVLTAAHCVWNTKRNAFYFNLNFAPGRYREAGKMVNPWGVVPWKSVTVFDAFKKNPATWDVAVVTLSKKLGSLTGYMGMAAKCETGVTLTVAGYPQDRQQGTCLANRCSVDYLDCNALTNIHTCDTVMGMSGSPLWDRQNRIRMIHVAGIQDKPENRATTVTQFLVNTISKW